MFFANGCACKLKQAGVFAQALDPNIAVIAPNRYNRDNSPGSAGGNHPENYSKARNKRMIIASRQVYRKETAPKNLSSVYQLHGAGPDLLKEHLESSSPDFEFQAHPDIPFFS